MRTSSALKPQGVADAFIQEHSREGTAAHTRQVFDVSGAADTVIAAFTSAIAAGASPVEAAMLANCAASVVLGKVGTATTSIQELLKSIPSSEFEVVPNFNTLLRSENSPNGSSQPHLSEYLRATLECSPNFQA